MKNVNLSLICFIIVLLFISCGRDDEPIVYPAPCVTPDIITDTISGFLIFEKGKQEYGFAKGIKINKPFETSTHLYNKNFSLDSIIDLVLSCYWPENRGHSALAEQIVFEKIQVNSNQTCFELTNNLRSKDSLFTSYVIVNDDAGILNYKLDLTDENIFEIISFEPEHNRLKARFKASYIANKEYLPDLPKKVRFSDVYIEHGY
ncbi:MAG: hypothetical protein LC107_00300 [Chitinophagales bacterium]|nr:hypothetical protein [Chitinophagales bacterium]